MPKRILICDDDRDILNMIAVLLEGEDMDLTFLEKSVQFFELVEEVKPQLVLLDLWMPVVSGDQLLRQLRRDERYAGLPVMIMSASRDGRRIAEEAGATAYLSKPFDIDELLDITHQLLELN